jgi:hypothetical protein
MYTDKGTWHILIQHLKSSLHEQAATTKAEAVQLLEEVAQMAQSSGAGTNDGAADQMRKRVAKLQYQWKQLEEEIEVSQPDAWPTSH